MYQASRREPGPGRSASRGLAKWQDRRLRNSIPDGSSLKKEKRQNDKEKEC